MSVARLPRVVRATVVSCVALDDEQANDSRSEGRQSCYVREPSLLISVIDMAVGDARLQHHAAKATEGL